MYLLPLALPAYEKGVQDLVENYQNDPNVPSAIYRILVWGVLDHPVTDCRNAVCADPVPLIDTLVVGFSLSARPSTWPPSVSPWALPASCGDRLHLLLRSPHVF